MKKLEIEIPDNKEIDWETSAKLKRIVLKDQKLTYEDVCKILFNEEQYFIGVYGNICPTNSTYPCPNRASTEHQLECILAKNKLANVARYLNGEWKNGDFYYFIWKNPTTNKLEISKVYSFTEYNNIMFKSKELAQQAIEILGEDVVQLALEPLY